MSRAQPAASTISTDALLHSYYTTRPCFPKTSLQANRRENSKFQLQVIPNFNVGHRLIDHLSAAVTIAGYDSSYSC